MVNEIQSAKKNASLFKSILSGCLGNVLEWYDYGLYGYFAVVISAEFFTSEDPVVSILMSFMVFGVGFVVRPIGGLIMGAYADKHGRVKSLTVTIMAIGICTMLMGCLPTYEQIGIMAPILLTVLRLLQGWQRAASSVLPLRSSPSSTTARILRFSSAGSRSALVSACSSAPSPA